VTSRRAVVFGGAAAGVALLGGCNLRLDRLGQGARPRRIGWLLIGSEASSTRNIDTFTDALRELGYVEGRDVVFEYRYADAREERLPALAAELVRLSPDLILTAATPAIIAAEQATPTIPIVFATAGADPVADGVIASLSRPGGNATGITLYAGQEHAKRLQLFKEALPDLARVAVLWHQSGLAPFEETRAAAPGLGLQIVPLKFTDPDQLEAVLDGAVRERADGLIVTSGSPFAALRERIVAWAAANKLPAMYAISPFAEPGGLMVYAADVLVNWRRAASYVDRIFKGAKPGDLPVEKPTAFGLVVNLKTAQALGVTIAPTVLQQATEVVQ
jgi:putative ABC transport system substrate-binding protein